MDVKMINERNMKRKLILVAFASMLMATIWSCSDQYGNYPGGVVSTYIGIYDVRNLYKGSPVPLNEETLEGSSKITGVVISDHREGNIPEGLLILQDRRRLNLLRGISVSLGAAASNYITGDSVVVDLVGATLDRVDGILQVTNIGESKVQKVGSDIDVPVNRVNISAILENPGNYESTLVAVVKGGFNPLPSPTDVLAGDKVVNDGFGNLTLRTRSTVSFANNPLPILANYYGIIFNEIDANGELKPYHSVQKAGDIVVLSAEINVVPILISGFINDPIGTDANNEYIQLLATEDIDFSMTPYSLVTTNNAGASAPAGFPVNGWATGEVRTYKFDLTSGTVRKGEFFYVGGTNKLINGPNSTSIADANWIASHPYNTQPGFGFGRATANLLANSGNAFGMAVFRGTTVTVESVPLDVIFIATGGSLYTPGPPARGYRIANTDFYDIIDPITLTEQPFYRSGNNTSSFRYTSPANLGYFYILGGEYNVTLGRWTTARTQTNIILTKESLLSEIEGEGVTIVVE